MKVAYVDRARRKRCLHCKYFWLWGLGVGVCERLNKGNDYKSSNNHCKYYKRNNEVFYSDGRVKNQERYNEIMGGIRCEDFTYNNARS